MFCTIKCDHCSKEAQTTIAVNNFYTDGKQHLGRVALPSGWMDVQDGRRHLCDDPVCLASGRRNAVYAGHRTRVGD